jgi:hypothetical protein
MIKKWLNINFERQMALTIAELIFLIKCKGSQPTSIHLNADTCML